MSAPTMRLESLFTPATAGGMALMTISAPIAPTGGSTYGAVNPGQVIIPTNAGQQYFIMSGANEIGTVFNNGAQTQALTAAGQSFVFTAQGGTIYFSGGVGGAQFTGSVQPCAIQGSVPANTTRSTSSQRLRLFSKPGNPVVVKVLGKMAYVPMTYAYHEPLIKASSQAVMQFALSAMLKRARQYAKATAEERKAAALLADCAKLHAVQRTNNQRFIPDGGFGEDMYFGPSNRSVFGTYPGA